MKHVLVVANETVYGSALIDALRPRAEEVDLITVIAPVSHPREGYVVYEDTRRASAGRRLDRALHALREAGIPAHGLVTEANPVDAVRDAVAQLEPRPTEIVVSTHPLKKSGWLRKNVVDRIRACVGDIPVEHVVVDLEAERGVHNVLVIANETVVGEPLLDAIRKHAQGRPATFVIVSPQSDPTQSAHPEAERRLRLALTKLRAEGIDAHGQIAHPDPVTAAVHAARDERVDEIIVSTYPQERSRWRRGDVVGRIRRETGLPVDHVVVEPEQVEEAVSA